MIESAKIVRTDELQTIADSKDFPLAALAATRLMPYTAQGANHLAGGHAGQVKTGNGNAAMPQDVVQAVTEAVKQLQDYMLQLKRLELIHPEQKEAFAAEHASAGHVAGVLVSAYDMVQQTHAMTSPAHANGNGRHAEAAMR